MGLKELDTTVHTLSSLKLRKLSTVTADEDTILPGMDDGYVKILTWWDSS